MTVVLHYGLFCYIRTWREPDFLLNLPNVQCAVSKFYQFWKFLPVRALCVIFVHFA